MSKAPIDYSVYLVTDSTPEILGDRNLVEVVEAALQGGVTCVQYRDKTCDAETARRTAAALHVVTKKYGVPLLINDRVDVAVDVGCEGVHIGQDDMEYSQARRLLGPDKIIGVSASSIQEAVKACGAGADYLGLGTLFPTLTKKDTRNIIGTAGVKDILSALAEAGHGDIPTVCIGGVGSANAKSVLVECSVSPRKSLDGIAAVSAIVGSPDPAEAARDLFAKVVAGRIPDVIRAVHQTTPLSHNMTNTVVQNLSANIALAVGASPIMSTYGDEAMDIARHGGALVVNTGTITPEALGNYVMALKAYNDADLPVILDPVGAGATAVRREAVRQLLSVGKFTIIKGNESEIQAIEGTSLRQRGVDSTASLSLTQRASLVRSLARRTSAIVVLTGATDLLSDGSSTIRVDNGHPLLGRVSGTGCCLATVLSAMVAAFKVGSPLIAAVAGSVMYGVAAQRAARRDGVRGPGTFVPAFIDELHALREETVRGDIEWLKGARVEVMNVRDESR
ncbi:putative thiamine biosynthetic bifunctional enzyme [Escovopsis weberi]|uniref:Putative thiamine biosynthetic bifunctional enzyme n=1 Tax=Escovopsis weberi TaxID=150374 RepID=A0A0N0RT03_ESCWE|nr:putative thiamine biosynthetic bifunctional enzyme [Escovopsis weberi]